MDEVTSYIYILNSMMFSFDLSHQSNAIDWKQIIIIQKWIGNTDINKRTATTDRNFHKQLCC